MIFTQLTEKVSHRIPHYKMNAGWRSVQSAVVRENAVHWCQRSDQHGTALWTISQRRKLIPVVQKGTQKFN